VLCEEQQEVRCVDVEEHEHVDGERGVIKQRMPKVLGEVIHGGERDHGLRRIHGSAGGNGPLQHRGSPCLVACVGGRTTQRSHKDQPWRVDTGPVHETARLLTTSRRPALLNDSAPPSQPLPFPPTNGR
jgi:hypothetical protein